MLQLNAEAVEKSLVGKNIDEFKPGDSVEVQYLLSRTGGKVQRVKGVVLARRNRGTGSSFIIRNVSGAVYIMLIAIDQQPAPTDNACMYAHDLRNDSTSAATATSRRSSCTRRCCRASRCCRRRSFTRARSACAAPTYSICATRLRTSRPSKDWAAERSKANGRMALRQQADSEAESGIATLETTSHTIDTNREIYQPTHTRTIILFVAALRVVGDLFNSSSTSYSSLPSRGHSLVVLTEPLICASSSWTCAARRSCRSRLQPPSSPRVRSPCWPRAPRRRA